MKKVNMDKKTKDIYRMILFLIVILLSCILAYDIIKNKNNNKEVIENKDKQQKYAELPALELVDYNENPLLYDYINGSLGYNYKKDSKRFTNYGAYYAIAKNNNFDNTIFISFYNLTDNIIYPLLGTNPIRETEFNKELFNEYTSKMNEKRIYNEGDWNFYIISLYKNDNNDTDYDICSNYVNWAGIHLEKYNNIENGLMYEKIYNRGLGWPTEWLREEPFNSYLKNSGLDINNKFFDKYNIMEKIYYENLDNQILEVKVIALDRFNVSWSDEIMEIPGEDNLEMFLEENNYTIKDKK